MQAGELVSHAYGDGRSRRDCSEGSVALLPRVCADRAVRGRCVVVRVCLLGSAGSSCPSRAAPGSSLCPPGDAFQEDTELGEASGEVQLD